MKDTCWEHSQTKLFLWFPENRPHFEERRAKKNKHIRLAVGEMQMELWLLLKSVGTVNCSVVCFSVADVFVLINVCNVCKSFFLKILSITNEEIFSHK